MKTFDDNWQSLRDEDRTLSEKSPHSMLDAEEIRVVQWNNNTRTQKLSWRQKQAPYTAWIDCGDHKGLWRSIENRLFEEIQYQCAIERFGQGYRVLKSTARFETGDPMINVKTIMVMRDNTIEEILLLLDGQRIYTALEYTVKNGQGWRFKNSLPIQNILCCGSQGNSAKTSKN